MHQPLKSNHDLVVLNKRRSQVQEDEVQGESKIMIKRNLKETASQMSANGNESTITGSTSRKGHESFLRHAIIKDEEMRQTQSQDSYKRKETQDLYGNTANIYSNNFVDTDREARTLKFRRFVEQASELEDDDKGESQNEDDERDDMETEDEDSDDENDIVDENGVTSKKRKSFRVKPDPKYNGKKIL